MKPTLAPTPTAQHHSIENHVLNRVSSVRINHRKEKKKNAFNQNVCRFHSLFVFSLHFRRLMLLLLLSFIEKKHTNIQTKLVAIKNVKHY